MGALAWPCRRSSHPNTSRLNGFAMIASSTVQAAASLRAHSTAQTKRAGATGAGSLNAKSCTSTSSRSAKCSGSNGSCAIHSATHSVGACCCSYRSRSRRRQTVCRKNPNDGADSSDARGGTDDHRNAADSRRGSCGNCVRHGNCGSDGRPGSCDGDGHLGSCGLPSCVPGPPGFRRRHRLEAVTTLALPIPAR